MRLLIFPALALVLAAGACSSPSGPREAASGAPGSSAPGPTDGSTGGSADGFDARAWLAEAHAAGLDTVTALPDYESPLIARMRALADPLDEATGWRRACVWPEEGATAEDVDRAMGDSLYSWPRATFTIHPFGPDEALVPITCDFGAYQGLYAIAHLHGSEATLLSTTEFGPSMTDNGDRTPRFSTVLAVDPDARTFVTFALARGLGDCGTRSLYHVEDGGRAEVVEIRARDCDIQGEVPPIEEWPVVFPAR